MIPRATDPVVEELKRIVTAELEMPCSFMYANLFEANFGIDSLDKEDDFPVCVFVATEKNTEKIIETGLIIRKIEVYCLLLNSNNDPTIDYSSEQVDPFVNQMRMLAENLIHRINHSDKTYVFEPVDEFECSKIYEKFDRHLFGVALRFTWSFNTGISGCYP